MNGPCALAQTTKIGTLQIMKRNFRSSISMLILAFLGAGLLSSCFHVLIQQNVAKGKFKKKHNCPFKEITIVEDDFHSQKDTFKLVGCGVTAYYKGTDELLSQK